MMSVAKKFFLTLFIAITTTNVLAHDIDVTGVARIFLDEVGDNQYRLSIVDQQVPPLLTLDGVIPPRCIHSTTSIASYQFSCTPQLNSQDTIQLPWSLEGVVVVARWGNGESSSAFFRGTGAAINIALAQLQAGASSLGNLAYSYLALGAEHILFGFDHLLFVFGLLLLLQGIWPLVKTITAFTIAHSISLGLAVLGFISVPSAPIEIIIALSIILLAREILMGQRGKYSLVHHSPWLIAFSFGLFHGLGFAGALADLGLRENDIPLALLFFNLGVEAGQLGFIALILLIKASLYQRLASWMPRLQTILAYSLGGIATYWFIERLPSLLPA
jgi:hypothetical protein